MKGDYIDEALTRMQTERRRKLTLDTARARYVHRFTMDHVPEWSQHQAPGGKYYAPQFRSDREWYENTKFPGEAGYPGFPPDCYTTGQTWPLGQWLDQPYSLARK